jgi:hypothetical protein
LEIEEREVKTMMPSSVLRGLQLLGAGGLLAFGVASHASTLSWHDAPIMGSNVDYSVPGQLTVTVNGSPAVIPDTNALPSQSVFVINPNVWDGTHWHDPSVWAWAASSVNVALDSTYAYTGHWDFLGNGSNPAYGFDFPSDTWDGAWGFTVAELYSSVGDFWLEDAGNWRYTETWTGTSGSDRGASITATRDFAVQVPEPTSLALVGLALFVIAANRRSTRR